MCGCEVVPFCSLTTFIHRWSCILQLQVDLGVNTTGFPVGGLAVPSGTTNLLHRSMHPMQRHGKEYQSGIEPDTIPKIIDHRLALIHIEKTKKPKLSFAFFGKTHWKMVFYFTSCGFAAYGLIYAADTGKRAILFS